MTDLGQGTQYHNLYKELRAAVISMTDPNLTFEEKIANDEMLSQHTKGWAEEIAIEKTSEKLAALMHTLVYLK